MLRKRNRLNKKGSLQDIIFVGVVILFFAMVILISFKVVSEINTNLQSNDIIAQYDSNNYARDASSTLTSYFPGVIDNTFLIFAIGLALTTLALAALVRVHPVFIAFFFIGLVLVIFFSGIFSNIYQEMAASTALSAEADQLVFISTVLEYLPLLTAIIGILLMIVMYKIWKDGVT